jgi:hypothetical protein
VLLPPGDDGPDVEVLAGVRVQLGLQAGGGRTGQQFAGADRPDLAGAVVRPLYRDHHGPGGRHRAGQSGAGEVKTTVLQVKVADRLPTGS